MFWVFLLVLQGQEKSDSYWNVPPTNMSITALRVFQDINISFQTTMHWWHRYNSCVICACTVLSIDQRFQLEMRLRVGGLSLHLGKWHGGRGRCLGATKCKHCRFGEGRNGGPQEPGRVRGGLKGGVGALGGLRGHGGTTQTWSPMAKVTNKPGHLEAGF